MDDDSDDDEFSAHVKMRAQQRGVKKKLLGMVIRFADREIPVRNGHTSLSVSKTELKRLVCEGSIDAQAADKLKKLAVVIANDNEESNILTVVRPEAGSKGRHYLKKTKNPRGKQRRGQKKPNYEGRE